MMAMMTATLVANMALLGSGDQHLWPVMAAVSDAASWPSRMTKMGVDEDDCHDSFGAAAGTAFSQSAGARTRTTAEQ